MESILARLRARLLPALLVALGVTFIAAGLLEYTLPVDAGPGASPTPNASPRPSPGPTPTPFPTLPTGASPTPIPADRVTTRVVVAALGIDLPVIRQPDPSYPSCDVAMYLEPPLGQPGQGRATYLYAHAQEGMFWPIRALTKTSDGSSMLGMIVEVYTSDDRLFLYEVVEVRLHQTTLQEAVDATTEQLWLQTSETPRLPAGVVGPKSQVIALPLSEGPADHDAAHPVAAPRDCS